MLECQLIFTRCRDSLNKFVFKFSKYFVRLVLLILIISFLSAYQPVWEIPPIQKSIVRAETFPQIEEIITKDSFSEEFKLPHPGYLSSKFSVWHPGVDIASGLGMPVHPVISGKVVDVQYTFWGLGNFVTLEHERGYKSTYAHLGRIYVKVGDSVKSDSQIGTVGLSGWTSGPHTHLEVSKDNKNIDPLKVLPEIPKWEEYAKNQDLVAGKQS